MLQNYNLFRDLGDHFTKYVSVFILCNYKTKQKKPMTTSHQTLVNFNSKSSQVCDIHCETFI